MDPVHDDFGVGIGVERVPQRDQLGAQRLVILDDAVVHYRDAVAGNVRVRIAGRRFAVRRPARMGNAGVSSDGMADERIRKRLDLADRAHPLELARAVDDREAGRIVAAILESAQALEQNGHDIALSDDSDDSAHASLTRGP